jgi:predicted negative regulator of RcsB-dependent stress response
VVSLGTCEVTVIARVLCATAQSEQAAATMAELWGEQVGRFERTAPGFQGAVLLREGDKLLAVSCWDGEGTAEAALEPLLDRMASSDLDALLAKPLSCRFRTL